MKDKTITSNELLIQLMAKGIKISDMGWNPAKRKLGYSKVSSNKLGSYSFSFYYFAIDDESKIIDCPRGFTKLRGYTITDFDILLKSLIN